ncbi:MAG: polysulfide reductase NrfD [Gemmataceae bacterium]|nr:polysulfide reductase NrfD [Gemmataceae bacterium]
MNLFVADPDWGWWIVGYFFLGGIAAGCYFIASLLELFGQAEDQALARLGYCIAFPLVLVCGLFLVLDLNRPERFWHMLLQSEVVHEAFEQGWPWSAAGWEWMVYAPMLKEWSPMSIGAWAVFLFGGFSFASCWAGVWPAGRIARLLNWRVLRWPWRLAGSGVGFFVASYTGVLLAATNQPIWSQTDWLGALFLCSATSTALAALVLLGRRPHVRDRLWRLDRAEIGAVGLELVVFLVFLVSLWSWLPALLSFPMGWLLVGAPLTVGMAIPLALRLGWLGTRLARPLVHATLVLAGGFLLRYAVVMTPPALLEHRRAITVEAAGESRTPAGWFVVSPEDSRPRDGGEGASALNRPPALEPRSKVFVADEGDKVTR